MSGQRALVLDAAGQPGLRIVRSLGRRGVDVTAGAARRWTLGGLSRHADGRWVHPDPATDAGRFVDDLLAHLSETDYGFVFGSSDGTSILLSRHKDAIAATGTTAAVADPERFALVNDKARFFGDVIPDGVPAPETHAPASLDEVRAIADDVTYPAVVKPRSKTVWDESGRRTRHLVGDGNYVDGPRDLVATFRRLLADAPVLADRPPVVQTYVPGETTTTCVLADDGAVRAHFQERRLRTHPASGGNSTLLGAVDDPVMLGHAARVVEALRWTGPAQFEFMERPDGGYELIEVNGRYWGSLPFAVTCGVDVPWLHYRQLRGESVSHDGDYRTDVVERRMVEDGKWLLEQLADGNLRALGPFLADFRRANHTFVSTSDPLPTLWAVSQAPRIGLDLVRRARRERTPDPVPPGDIPDRAGPTSRPTPGAPNAPDDEDRSSPAAGNHG